MLYIHHIATAQGSAGLQYSYTMLPTLEQVGASYGQYYIKHMRGDKAGVIYRNSSNWDPGRAAFDKTVTDAGVTIVDQEGVVNNQGDYTSQIVKLEQSGAQTVLIWENAVYAEQIIQQAHNQGYNPKWVLFPFNLTLQTLEKAGVNPNQMQGLLPLPAYTCPSLRGSDPSYNTYKSEFEQFEAAYAKYDSGANLCGGGGDLLFETWEAWKQTADLLTQCGPSCTRNKLAGLLDNGYHAQVGANCPIDFRGDGHHGGGNSEDEYVVRNVNGTDIWANVGGFCQGSIQ
jgi:ABC-type branched-subunit amino acid transport system substrate-binding protein